MIPSSDDQDSNESEPNGTQVPDEVEQLLTEYVPAEKRQVILARLNQYNLQVHDHSLTGLPADPHSLRRLDELVPGSAGKIVDAYLKSIETDLDTAQSESEARTTLLESEPKFKGQTLRAGLFIFVVLIGGAFLAAHLGHDNLSLGLAGVAGFSIIPRIVTAWRKNE